MATAPAPDAEPDAATKPSADEPGADVPSVTADPVESPLPEDRSLQLYFLRHADAGDPAEWPGDDADRPLSKKGRRQARRLGNLLRALQFTTESLITSPKLRAADTANVVARRIGAEATIDQRLAGGLEADGLAELIDGLDPRISRVIIVGHDPEFSSLLSWLVGSPISLRKGALARADLPDRRVGAGMGSLRWLLPPDAIPN